MRTVIIDKTVIIDDSVADGDTLEKIAMRQGCIAEIRENGKIIWKRDK